MQWLPVNLKLTIRMVNTVDEKNAYYSRGQQWKGAFVSNRRVKMNKDRQMAMKKDEWNGWYWTQRDK